MGCIKFLLKNNVFRALLYFNVVINVLSFLDSDKPAAAFIQPSVRSEICKNSSYSTPHSEKNNLNDLVVSLGLAKLQEQVKTSGAIEEIFFLEKCESRARFVINERLAGELLNAAVFARGPPLS